MKTRKGDNTLIQALAKGMTVADAARIAGVSRATAFRRLQEPAFRTAVQDTRSIIVTETIGKLIGAGTSAADTLCALLSARAEHVRLGSARAILELAPKLRESEELSERITRLEQQLDIMQPNGKDRRWPSRIG